MEEKTVNAGVQAQNRPVRRQRKKKNNVPVFKYVYLSVLAVLLVLSICTLSYVHRSLKAYEASQPENILSAQIEQLRELNSKGKFEEGFSFETMRSEYGATEEEIAQFKKFFIDGEITFREDLSKLEADKKVYHVLCDGVKVAKATLNHLGQETRMLVFTMDHWSADILEATGYELNLTAPPSAIIKNNGNVLQGEIVNGNAVYDIRSLVPLNVEICDILGNSVSYDADHLPVFTDYQITIPSNYTIQGVQTLSPELAVVEDIPELNCARDYCSELPGLATYRVSLLSGEPNVKILDQKGNEVAYTLEGKKITLDGPVGQDTQPANIDVNPLEVAKLWSLFMTADLSGANYGYGQLSPYLIKGSALQDSAWKWATGIDITFTSSHRLKDPQFQVEEVSNYKVYSDDCFSCDIHLEKLLVLNRTGEEVNDVIHSRFYFVNYDDTDNGINDPHWVLVGHQEIH